MNRKVIYTIIFGDYDTLKEPAIVNTDFDYICFTNRNDLNSQTWTFRKVNCKNKNNLKRCAAELSVYPFKFLKGYELSVLVIGAISIHCDIGKFVQRYLPDDKVIAIMHHPKRDCIYEEAKVVLEFHKDKPGIVDKQIKRYRKDGFPEHAGLVSCGIIIRRHNDKKLIRHCRLWYREIKKYSQRDQLSFNYVLWKYNLIIPSYFEPEVRNSDFIVHPHNFVQAF